MKRPETPSHLISISRIQSAHAREVSVLRLRGVVRETTGPDFRARLAESGARSTFLVVDLSELEYLNSAGIGMLLRQARNQERRGGWLRLVSPSSAVAMILKLAGLGESLPVHVDLDEAVRDLSPRAA